MLVPLPCLDSPDHAAARRRELDLSPATAAALGHSAVAAAGSGTYRGPDGAPVDWRSTVQAAVAARRSLPPDAPLPPAPTGHHAQTRVQVANDTTLAAAHRLTDAGARPLALNFANGVVPGGGFLSGARAQEEALCRSSALYPTLRDDPMYAAHARRPRPDSSDWAILSPRVPVFRSDDGEPLAAPWLLDFVTCAAPYAPALGREEAAALLAQRIGRVLAIARAYGYDTLVLGAWGCGAFGNDAERTALDFHAALTGEFAGAFADITFAITDWSPERRFLAPFRDAFAGGRC